MNQNRSLQQILIIDDGPANLIILEEVLSPFYNIIVSTNGREALNIAKSTKQPDLILLDIMMPDMDGYEVCRRLKSSAITKDIPVIFVTAMDEPADETKGFSLGAVDYITKPISPPVVKARVSTHLALFDQNRYLEKMVQERTRELSATQDVTIRSLAILAEYRDNETGGHILRTQNYILILAEALKNHPRFNDFLGNQNTIDLLYKSTPLHDIGKVGIKDSILLKPGALTREEFEEMKQHTVFGRDALLKAEQSLGKDHHSSFLRLACDIAYTHHEKYDGSGYPNGLKGDDIPICGRLMAIADIYDALVSKRVYKPPFSHAKAVRIITKGDGRVEPNHCDPDILDAFIRTQHQFMEVARDIADSEEEREMLLTNE